MNFQNLFSTVLKALTITALLMAAGCVSMPYQPYARDVKKKGQQGGIIALKLDHRDEDRIKAQGMMDRTCQPLAVKVLEEGEVVVGQETKSSGNTSFNDGNKSQKVGDLFGMPVMSGGKDPSQQVESSTSTTQIKEWQINYECAKTNKRASR
ncbi:hypothetical protein D3C72_1867280 [compost metagenome]